VARNRKNPKKTTSSRKLTNDLGKRLKKLSPTAFENLVFDLISIIGLQNVNWRTPGADGGRDIEGDCFLNDLSGYRIRERWYIECKRYSNAVAWPIVFEKLSFASNHQTDYLLFVSTATPSPACTSEISTWNASNRSPKIRFWGGPELEALLLSNPILISKYSLSKSVGLNLPWKEPSVRMLAKTILSSYGSAFLSGKVTASIETAAATADLILGKYEELLKGLPQSTRPTDASRDLYSWVVVKGKPSDLRQFDARGLRLLLSSIRYCYRLESLDIRTEGEKKLFISHSKALTTSPVIIEAFEIVSLNSNLAPSFHKDGIIVNLR
jgi:hypothetical protein